MATAELEITADLIRDLLRDQHPDLADRPLALGARGWDNQLWAGWLAAVRQTAGGHAI